jgi:hypothetical protein
MAYRLFVTPGLTRGSIVFHKALSKKMDDRIKSGHDGVDGTHVRQSGR